MKKSETNPSIAPSTLEQASHLFAAHQQTIYESTDRMFAVLMSVQWLAGVIAALWIAPRTWIGTSSQTHIHVWAAVFLGGAISFFPISLAIAKPGATSTRYVIATAQMLMSALLIYLTGGRIETHFHVFGSLAFLAFYRDWRVLVPATIVVAADHFLRGIFWPQSVYGVLSASEWRWLEHAGWVLFEDTFLFIAIKRSVGEMWGIAQRTAELNDNEERYRAVVEQTAEGLVLADVDTKRVLECNVAFADLLGYTVKEALKLTAYDFIVDQREAIDRRSGTLLDRRLPITGERRFRRKDGSIIDVELNVSVIVFGGKHVFCTIVRDISERKQAEEALRQTHEVLEMRVRERTAELAAANDGLQREAAERKAAEDTLRDSEERYRLLFDSNPLPLWVYDVETLAFLAVNNAAVLSYGYSREEFLAITVNDIRPPEDVLALRDAVAVAKVTERIDNLGKWRHRKKDGSIIDVEITSHKLEFAGRLARIVLAVDITERERAEKALQESQQWLRAIFDSSRDGIIVEENENIAYVNQSYAHLFGYEPGELIGQPVWLVSEQEPSQRMLEYSRKRLRGEEAPSLYEFQGTRKDQTKVDLEASVSAAKIGAKTCIISLCRDISERKQALEKIGQLAQIVESSHDAILATDLQANIVSWNHGAERIYGYRAEEILGKQISLLAPAERQEEISQKKQKLESESGNRIAPYEAERLRKDGQRIQVSVSLSRLKDAGGRIVGSSIIARDITERKRMEGERQAMFDIIQGVNSTDNLDELLGLIRTSIGKLLYAENCFVALHDPATDFIHFPFWVDKVDPCPQPRPVGIGFSSYVLRTGKPMLVSPETTEEMYRRGEIVKSGSTSASWLGVPLRTQSRTIGVLVVQHYEDEDAYDERDLEFLASVGNQVALVIERKRAETNLRETEDQLRQSQKMEGIGTLAGGIAHDFNNLMTAVTGYSELALRHLEAGDPLRPKIEEIKKAGERAATLTRQLLAFSRKQILQARVLDLNTVVSGMGKMLPRMIGEDIDLLIELGASLGQIKADPGQIEQILMNLAVNARDAMPEGGRLTIKTENVHFDGKFAQPHLVVEPGHYVTLSVLDNGCGMDAETQAHIFEPFFTTKEVGKGTGLGLSTVYGIVKQSGGSIWVYSEVGKGTAFKIYLPRVDDIIEIEESGNNSRSVPRGRETILLVEDEEVVRDLSKEILEEYGYSVITAPNGKEGLRICKEFEGHIDLMITDVVMPQMSGPELAENVTALRPDTRVLYMSGFTDDLVVRHGVAVDGFFFIQKPFSPDSLALKTREVLDHGGSSPTDGAAFISAQGRMKHSETIRRN